MARKSNSSHKKKVPDAGCATNDKGQGKPNGLKVFPAVELHSDNQKNGLSNDSPRITNQAGSENKIKQSSGNLQRKQKEGLDELCDMDESASYGNSPRDSPSPLEETSSVKEENVTLPGNETGSGHGKGVMGFLQNGFHMNNMIEKIDFSGNLMVRNLRESALSMLKAAGEWLEKQRPLFSILKTKACMARDYVKVKIEQTYPVILKWLIHFGNIILLLSMVWLDCTLRGIDSFLRLGTSSFFSVIWCSILSVFAMVGFFKFLVALAIASLVGVFIGVTLGLLVLAISGTVFLWLYGSFWLTALVIIMGGSAFMLSHERVALFITAVYSMYCAWTYVGWIGLLLALNLSFISSDILIYILKNNISQQRRSYGSSERSTGTDGRPGFYDGESFHATSFETDPEMSADRSPGVASTSGADSELTSEDEVVRLLNCTDHYSALGFARYENVDVSLLKREYRKKAMLVHPDKNMGNEKAAEAFKKLQNAYEVLLDSLKRKAYNDELRKEDLLNYLRRFQSTSQKNGAHGYFSSGFAHSGVDGEDPFGEPRRITCKKCNNFHVWVLTKKSKSQARWCQDCKDFHQAKDGDGWVEQSSQPLFFGILQKVDAPSAYVCADSKIYDATEWYICQGMRCPANTHKPSFHVNTSVTSKHNTSKGSSSGQRGNRMPTSNMEETMTEEEFFEWLQNAVQSGMFDNFNGSTSAESPFARAGNGPKNSGSSGGSSNGNKRKKKGKKQW